MRERLNVKAPVYFSLISDRNCVQYIRTLREQIYEARDMRGVPLLVVGNKQDELSQTVASGTRYRDIVNLVRKHWRCGYVECSARFNCRVVQVRDIHYLSICPLPICISFVLRLI